MNKKIYALLMCVTLLLGSAIPVSATSNANVKISKTQVSIGVKQSYNLKLSNNKKKVKWSSNKKSVATVNSKGKVTAKRKGTAIITASVGKAKYKCKVTVKNPVLSKSKISLNTNKSYNLKLLYNKKKVKWSSNNKSIVTVNSKGKITAKKKGTATITARVGSTKYKCKVTVKLHTHKWVNITKTVNHPAITHQEDIYENKQVCVKEAWDEQVVTNNTQECSQCGYRSSDPEEMGVHCFKNGHSCHNVKEYKTVHHDAVYETRKVKTGTKTVTDKAAWTETKVVGRKCSSCGKKE